MTPPASSKQAGQKPAAALPLQPLCLKKVRLAYVSLWLGIVLSGISIFMYGPLQVAALLLGMGSLVSLFCFMLFSFRCPKCKARLPLKLLGWNGVIRGYCSICRWEAKYK